MDIDKIIQLNLKNICNFNKDIYRKDIVDEKNNSYYENNEKQKANRIAYIMEKEGLIFIEQGIIFASFKSLRIQEKGGWKNHVRKELAIKILSNIALVAGIVLSILSFF
ncbi:MAG: hypothetical protein ABJ218_04915 [Winogradskyella arenosi]